MASFFSFFLRLGRLFLTSSKRAKVERVVPQRLVKIECGFGRLTFGARDALEAGILRPAMTGRLILASSSEKPIHLNARVRMDRYPRPVFRFRAQTSSHRILPDVIHLG